MEAIRASGEVLAPLIIFKGAAMYMGWVSGVEATHQAYFAYSSTGYTNDDLTLQWLQRVFTPAVCNNKRWKLLILDNHHSHVTHNFLQYAWDHQILCLCLPPHTTHALQPLDVGLFGPLATAYKQEIQQIYNGSLGNRSISKDIFYPLYKRARDKTYQSVIIKSAFRSTGIAPFNPQKVYRKFNLFPKESTPPPIQQKLIVPVTPHTPRSVKRLRFEIVQEFLEFERGDSSGNQVIESVGKMASSAEWAMAQASIAFSEVEALKGILMMKGKADRRKLRTEAVLIDSQEALNLVKEREEEAIRIKQKRKRSNKTEKEEEDG